MNSVLPEAPGAKAARICGILAILSSLSCIGIPLGIVLGIVAIVKNSKARGLERSEPESYRRSSGVGLAMGIVGLALSVVMVPFAGIVSAIAIPAALAQRERAREAACNAALVQEMTTLQAEFERLADSGIDQGALLKALEAKLAACSTRNPYGPGQPAFKAEIRMVEATAEDEVQYQIEPLAEVKGEMFFVVAFPFSPQQPGYLGGAVRTDNATNPVICNVVELK